MLKGTASTVVCVLLLLPAWAETAACAPTAGQVLIPPGPFWLGSDASERLLASRLSTPDTVAAGWFAIETARHRAEAEAFCIDRLLVTQAQYLDFVARTHHVPPRISQAEYARQGFLVHDYSEWIPYLWKRATPPRDRLDHPVVLVTALDAEAYCRWRHAGGRLPTDLEWEKAARGIDGRTFPWGNSWDPERLNSAAQGPGGTTPVGIYGTGASPFGILDAVGNVFQWTNTRQLSGLRVLKGCAWDDDAGLCRPAASHARPASSRHILIGFRCAGPVDNP
jgi:formylglycine-generating enzyme required for sulfatase activity